MTQFNRDQVEQIERLSGAGGLNIERKPAAAGQLLVEYTWRQKAWGKR